MSVMMRTTPIFEKMCSRFGFNWLFEQVDRRIGGYKIQARDEQVLVPRQVYLIGCLCAAYLIATVARRL